MVGWRQRVQRERSRSPPREPVENAQFRRWLHSWAWGGASAAEVVRQARAAKVVGTRAPCIDQLLKGSGDIHNAERVLLRMIPHDILQQTIVEGSCVERVILPRDCFKWVMEKSPRLFQHRLGASPNGVAEWWAQLKASPDGAQLFRCHPWLRGRSPADLAWFVPLAVHDDAGPVSQNSSAFVRNWFSLLGHGRETETRFLLSTLVKEEHSLPDRSWPVILNSFEQLAFEQNVSRDRWGAILLFVSGDMDYLCNELGMPHFNSIPCCAFCGATNGPAAPHNDYHHSATWRGTLRTNASFKGALEATVASIG